MPDSFTEHMRLMFDLQVLALETDMTRIITFKTGRDSQNRVFPECESTQPFHPASHHGNREDRILEFNKICKFRVGQLPYFLDKLKSSMDGDQNLLDKTVVMWGSPMSDANVHNHRRCPLVLLGHGNGILEGNLHLKAADGHADGQRHAVAAQAPRSRGRLELRRQHRRVLVPAVGDHRLGAATRVTTETPDMRLRLSLNLIAVVALTALVARRAAVVVARRRRGHARQPRRRASAAAAGRRRQRRPGRRHERAALGRRSRRRRADGDAGLRRRQSRAR